MTKLSVVISAFNEEKRIAFCLESVVNFADEIIVVDNSSLDKTNTIAKKFTRKVFRRENYQMLNINKNYGFTKATGDWILYLDADESITSELAQEIKVAITNVANAGYWIPRRNIIFGKWIENGLWWPDYQLRLFKRGLGKFPQKHVHEMIMVTGATEKLHEPMIHENYSSISQYLNKLNIIYTENEAENFISSGKQISWMDALRFPINDFLKTFFAQKGYRDGLHGLVLSLLQAFYAEIVFAKIWEKQGFFDYNDKNFLTQVYCQGKKIAYEVQYWFLSSAIETTGNIFKKTKLKFLRKLILKKINN